MVAWWHGAFSKSLSSGGKETKTGIESLSPKAMDSLQFQSPIKFRTEIAAIRGRITFILSFITQKVEISEMKLKTGNASGGATGCRCGGRKVVLVGVKLEQRSRELLTWTLMKIAQPGDLVIALHVVQHSSSGEKSSLLSLVNTFDSVLAVYEGFCHLKQVNLKLKLSRGSSLRKTLIEEAKMYHSATIVVGTSKNHQALLLPTSVAKHCARKLSHYSSVVAVNNGKIVFQRKAAASDLGICRMSSCRNPTSSGNCLTLSAVNSIRKEVKSYLENSNSLDKRVSNSRSTIIKRYFGCGMTSKWSHYPYDLPKVVESCIHVSSDSPLRSITYQIPELSLKPKRISKGKISLVGRFSRFRAPHSAMMADPNEKRVQSKNQLSNLSGKNGGLLPVGVHTVSPPKSPIHRMKGFGKQFDKFYAKYSCMCKLYKYKELLSATSGFLPERMIGRGGSSCVFRGRISDGKEVAVKILKSSEEVFKEFIAEIEIVTSISHKNIISLLGFCIDYETPILVYNLLPRGSLEENLHGDKKDVTKFGYEERYKVALGVAKALHYLHTGSSEPVIHRDIKSSNILLADDFEPQLADFGLATWASTASSFTTCTNVAGTFGYLAPEYFMHGKVTEKIDVYAFGVVLLELLSGRKPIDSRKLVGQKSLILWATPILKAGKISQLLDARLSSGHYVIERMALAATHCIRRVPLYRPRISIILKILQGDPEVTKWAKKQISTCSEFEVLDGVASSKDIQSHLNTAFLDLDDDASFTSGSEPSVVVEDYLRGRGSRLPSFS